MLNIVVCWCGLASSGFGFEEIVSRVEEGAGQAKEDCGEYGGHKTYHKQKERHCLKGNWTKMKEAWKPCVELAKEFKVVVVLDHHSSEDYEGALRIEEQKGNSIAFKHSLLLFWWNWDRDKEGNKDVNHFVLSQQWGEILIKSGKKDPPNAESDDNRDKK